mmetsp:Transcript_74434/g.206712  ORF Transcript_74434/g.206712 Transcript_74434/m.206712 type:complete len:159 (-) Transcript_74434:124-600(-)
MWHFAKNALVRAARAPSAKAIASRHVPAPIPLGHLAGGPTGSRRFFSEFNVCFVDAQGTKTTTVSARSGQTILEVAHAHDIDIEGACGGECACSTCHVILTQEGFDRLEPPDDDEADMLDLASHVTDTSRLGCQVKLLKGRDDDMRIQLPEGMTNLLA